MAEKNGKKITLLIDGKEFEFAVSIKDYNAYLNEFMPANKSAPSENFATRCLVDQTQQQELIDIFEQGFALEVAQMLADEFKPDLEIKVKK